MENMVNVYFFGKKYSVPADLTIMTAVTASAVPVRQFTGSKAKMS